jgi:hypothetical protein
VQYIYPASYTFLVLALLTTEVFGQQRIQGYCRPDGSCVQGHFRTRPNDTAIDNYSTSGNWNPNSGRISTRELDIPATSTTDLTPPPLQVGPRGGQYYINENGRKVYVRR